jgi:hypothetical protein
MPTTDRGRLVAHIANASDQVNLTALIALDETSDLDDAGKLVRGLITEHLYDKHPQVKAAYDAWAESLDDKRTGPQVIADALGERRDIVGLAIETGAGIAVTAARVEGLIKHFGSGRVIAERDLVIHNHTLTAEGADMVRELAAAAEALARAGV